MEPEDVERFAQLEAEKGQVLASGTDQRTGRWLPARQKKRIQSMNA